MLEDNISASHDSEHQRELPKPPELPIRRSDHVYFAEEQKGWHGYVEWEKYPDKAKRAAEILSEHKFAGVSPLKTDPVSPSLMEMKPPRCPSSN